MSATGRYNLRLRKKKRPCIFPMRNLRILYLINNLEIGGAEIALANLVNELPTEDFEVWVGGIYGLGPVQKRFALKADRFVSFDFQIRRPFFDLPAFLRLFRFLRRNRIQIIHTHLPLANIIGRSIAWLAGVPIIISTEQSTYYEKSFPFVMADRLLARITTQMTAISQAVRLFSARQARLDPEKYLVIPNSIPITRIRMESRTEGLAKRRELDIGADQPVVITVGRLSPEKGQRVLIEAARNILEVNPSVLFLFVGDGPCRQALIRQAEQYGLDAHIKFLGYRQDISSLLQISTIMALPSLREGLSIALIEASACYLPIVASNVGGIPEVVENGVSGILVPPGDDKALAKSILNLLDSPDLQLSMGQAGRRIATNCFSSKILSEKIAHLYQRLWSEFISRRK
jgi:glycosyltransferase involved in cell wall biosynthesis